MAKKKIETAKKVLGFTHAMSCTFASLIIYGWFKGLPDAPQMLTAVLTFDGAVTGFYIWKSKAENIMKYGDKHPYKKEPSSGNNNSFGEYTPYASGYTNDTPYASEYTNDTTKEFIVGKEYYVDNPETMG